MTSRSSRSLAPSTTLAAITSAQGRTRDGKSADPTARTARAQRLALICLIALTVGATIGTLTYLASQGAPQAVLAGLVASGAALFPLDKLIGR